MCGITGQFFLNKNLPDPGRIERSVGSLLHRGPDNNAIYIKDNCAIGHTRLSIIDLTKSANQPMADESERYIIVFNGEIYNYREVRNTLTKSGVRFRTDSDTEVLLYQLIHKGIDGLNALNGFFAFAFFDTIGKELIVARDRFGIKPLYYTVQNGFFAFASELRSLLPYGIGKEISREALINYFRFNYIPAPLSILENVYKLMPGGYIVVNEQKTDQQTYYKPESTPGNLTDLMTDSVRLRLISDMEVGAFLSGGIDSSIIAALAVKQHRGIKTFSIGFEGNTIFDESKYAEKVAAHIGSEHYTIRIPNDQLAKNAYTLPELMDEPFADSSAVAVYALCKRVKEHVTVALSGDGADELFGGYNKHSALLRLLTGGKLTRITSKFGGMIPAGSRNSHVGNRLRQLKKLLKGAGLSPEDRYLLWSSFCSDYTISGLLQTSVSPFKDLKTKWNGSFMDYLRMDQELVLPNDMLKKVDSMSMLNSLEVRVPFLDHRVVAHARSLETDDLFDGYRGKKPLKESFMNLLPEDIFNRSKHGFEVPLKNWISNDLKTAINDTLSPAEIGSTGVMNAPVANKILAKSRSSQPGDSPYQVWAMFVLQKWITKNL